MEVRLRERLASFRGMLVRLCSGLIFKESLGTGKREFRFARVKWILAASILLFVTVVLFLPSEDDLQFSRKALQPAQHGAEGNAAGGDSASQGKSGQSEASSLWGSPKLNFAAGGGGAQINQNTSMIVGPKGGNAKVQLRAGSRLPIRILDKFIVAQDEVPILAELILDSVTDSGLKLPAGTRFYGEARFQKGADRATVTFKQISLPSGQIKPISGIAASKDGQPGIEGRVFSDGTKNTAGQVLTTFIGSLAAGSIQTDIFGRSQGGIQNGVLNAVSQTAQSRAQTYGEKLKAEREWIEVPAGKEADAILNDSLNLQEGGDSYEQR